METLENKLIELKEELTELELKESNFEVDESEHENNFDAMLNECYTEIFNIQPSRILFECDPIMYSCELSNYVDSLCLTFESEHEEDYNRIEEIKEEIEEIEEEIEEEIKGV